MRLFLLAVALAYVAWAVKIWRLVAAAKKKNL